MEKLELLAPSGNLESFKTAIFNGADAVYLGLGDFNARAKSTYFTTGNIRETVQFAHLYNVRVFVTINTLVADTEFSDFFKLVDACIDAKVDAYIVQDLGVAYLLKNLYPNIELHASTQLGIHNLSGAKIAEKLGFSRVVLSREAKLEDIKAIKQNTNLEIEYFIQGALCVAFSGNCYFSALQHNQSGNRGKCLQLCRLPYSAYINGNAVGQGYLLSARDLCLMPNLKELISAGVNSFKIEGRLRRAGYVGQAVQSYRKALDNEITTQNAQSQEIKKLQKVFSRGDFNTSAYLDAGVPDNVINKQIQNHLGVFIGKILRVEPFKELYKVKIATSHELTTGDGLKFLDESGTEVASLGVGNVIKSRQDYFIFTKHKLKTGLQVYLTLDKKLEDAISFKTRKINIQLDFTANENEPFSIFVETAQTPKTKLSFTSEYICQSAKTAPTTAEEIVNIFSTLDIEFFDVTVNAKLQNVFIPKSALKDARRQLGQLLKEQIISNYEEKSPIITPKPNKDKFLNASPNLEPEFSNIYIINESTDFASINATPNSLIALQPKTYSVQAILPTINTLQSLFKNVALVLPTIANEQDIAILDKIIAKLPKQFPLIINNLYGIKYANTNKLLAGIDMNVYNKYTVILLQNCGVTQFIWSKERAKSVENCFEYVYGHHELMHFCHCPFKTLFENTCKNCKFDDNLQLLGQDSNEFIVKRHKISQCYFTLLANKITNKQSANLGVYDLRFIKNLKGN